MPFVISFVIILFLVAVITFFIIDHFQNSLDLSEAYNLYYLGKYQEALSILEKKLEKHPNRYEIYSLRMTIQGTLQDYDAALQDVNKIIELNPENSQAYRCRSEIYSHIGETDKAFSDVNKALQLDPNFGLAYVTRALVLIDKKQYSESLIDSEYAIRKLHFEEFLSYGARGLANLRLKEYANAIYDFDKAYAYAETDDQRFVTLQKRFEAFIEFHDYPEALADAEEMLEIKASSESYAARGRVYRLMHENERSLADYQKAYELNPEDATSYLYVAVNYDILGEQAKAAAILEELIQNQKIANLAYNYRAWFKAFLGDYAGSLADADQAIAINAQISSFYDTRAQTKWLLDDFSGALADFQEAINRADKALPIYFLGKTAALYKLGREEEALSLWRETKPEAIETLQEEYRFAPPYYQCLLELEKRSLANG